VFHHHKSRQRDAREDRAYRKLVADLPKLASSSGPITREQAAAIIANDDRLFAAVGNHIVSSDEFEDNSEAARDIVALLMRVKPSKHSPLYRGECTHRFEEHKRGFHSWTVARDTADYFWKDCPRGSGRLFMLEVPVKGIDLGDVGLWRGRLRHESHYMSAQGEWLVLDGYPAKLIDEN